jgi:hypothetical protein
MFRLIIVSGALNFSKFGLLMNCDMGVIIKIYDYEFALKIHQNFDL